MDENYIQHTPGIPTGRQPFLDDFGSLPSAPVPNETDNLVAITAEGDLAAIALKHECKPPSDAGNVFTTSSFEVFRIAAGKIAEHWDYGTTRGGSNAASCLCS